MPTSTGAVSQRVKLTFQLRKGDNCLHQQQHITEETIKCIVCTVMVIYKE